jgi:hypothetical protein
VPEGGFQIGMSGINWKPAAVPFSEKEHANAQEEPT